MNEDKKVLKIPYCNALEFEQLYKRDIRDTELDDLLGFITSTEPVSPVHPAPILDFDPFLY